MPRIPVVPNGTRRRLTSPCVPGRGNSWPQRYRRGTYSHAIHTGCDIYCTCHRRRTSPRACSDAPCTPPRQVSCHLVSHGEPPLPVPHALCNPLSAKPREKIVSTGISFATSGGQGAQRKAPCCTTRTVRGLSDMPWRSQAAQEQREERLMQQICLRTCVMILAAVLAHAAPAVCADAADHPLQTRPISDFLEKQGQHLTKGIVPEFMSFTAYYNRRTGRIGQYRSTMPGWARASCGRRPLVLCPCPRKWTGSSTSGRFPTGAPRSPSNSIRATP